MKRKLHVSLIVLLLLVFSFNGAFAMGKLVSAQEKMIVVPYYDNYYYGYVFAELTNSGDKPVEFSSGLMELFDPDGNSISSADLYYCYPPVLQPGETAYVYGNSYLEAASPDTISDFMLSVTGQGTISQTVTRFEATARMESVEETYDTYDYIVAEIKNTLGEPLTDFEIVFAMKDEAGGLLYVISSYWSGYNVGVMPGSSVEMRYQLGTDISTYMKDNGIVPATVEAIVYNIQY